MRYLCQRRIRTLAENYVFTNETDFPKFSHDGIEYEPWSFNWGDGAIGYSWLASIEIEAMNLEEAHQIFRKKLLDSTPKIALISQCYTEFLFQPFIIRNIEKDHAYFFNIFDQDPVPLHFDEESLKALNMLHENIASSEFLNYWNDATNTVGVSPKMLLLFSAIEALCKKPNGNIDRAKRIKILGEELEIKFFENGNKGLRHRLVHGEYFQQDDFDKNYVLLIHQSVILYFNGIFGESLIATDVVDPQRNFIENKLQAAFFIQSTNNSELLLRDILEDYDTEEQTFKGAYDYVTGISIKTY
jgi:hypothetical protein